MLRIAFIAHNRKGRGSRPGYEPLMWVLNPVLSHLRAPGFRPEPFGGPGRPGPGYSYKSIIMEIGYNYVFMGGLQKLVFT